MEKNKKIKERILSIMLTLAMVVSLFAGSAPVEVQAEELITSLNSDEYGEITTEDGKGVVPVPANSESSDASVENELTGSQYNVSALKAGDTLKAGDILYYEADSKWMVTVKSQYYSKEVSFDESGEDSEYKYATLQESYEMRYSHTNHGATVTSATWPIVYNILKIWIVCWSNIFNF